MKLLFVGPLFPLPAHSGGQIAALETLRSLAPHCELHLLVPPPERDREANETELRRQLPDVHLHFYPEHVRRGLPMYATAALAAITGRSYWQLSWRNRALRRAVARLHARETFDVVHCEWLQPAFSLLGLDLPLVIRTLDIHFLDMEKWASGLPPTAWLRKKYWLAQSKRFRRVEAEMLSAAQVAVTLSAEDEAVLHECGVRNIVTIPPPRVVEAAAPSIASVPPLALFVGRLEMTPNREGFFEFANDVWPLVSSGARKNVRVVFAGGIAGDDIRRCAAECGIEIHSPLSDAEAARLFAEAAWFLSPVRSGTGIKIKTLDAMAHGKAMLGFRGAFRGVPAQSGVHAMVADSPAELARLFEQLIDDEPRRRAIGLAAQELIRTDFAPALLGKRLADVYSRIVKPMLKKESAFVRVIRACFRWWPFPRGSGFFLRLARLVLKTKPVTFDAGGAFIEGSLADWMILWTFTR
ncbi:MAG: polysaccharide biosynthesis protein PslH, partial [Thermoanaerobaculia bacterium]|nr:polysaccharide biosynthesis protein PslH [Thermoanaerobaculia bacterium]